MNLEMERAILLADNLAYLTMLMKALGKGPDQTSHELADAILMRAIQILVKERLESDKSDAANLLKAFDDLEKWYA